MVKHCEIFYVNVQDKDISAKQKGLSCHFPFQQQGFVNKPGNTRKW